MKKNFEKVDRIRKKLNEEIKNNSTSKNRPCFSVYLSKNQKNIDIDILDRSLITEELERDLKKIDNGINIKSTKLTENLKIKNNVVLLFKSRCPFKIKEEVSFLEHDDFIKHTFQNIDKTIDLETLIKKSYISKYELKTISIKEKEEKNFLIGEFSIKFKELEKEEKILVKKLVEFVKKHPINEDGFGKLEVNVC